MSPVRSVVPRAQRYRLPIPLAYRQVGRRTWLNTEVVNISESGVLFGASQLSPGTAVELLLALPIPIGALAPGKQVCVGAVVRTTTSGATATCFEECRVLPAKL